MSLIPSKEHLTDNLELSGTVGTTSVLVRLSAISSINTSIVRLGSGLGIENLTSQPGNKIKHNGYESD